MSKTELHTLHFDLSWYSHLSNYSGLEFTLLAGGSGKHVLQSYADNSSKLEQHRQTNKALALIPEDQLHRITHFVEDVPLSLHKMSIHRVVFPSMDDHPLPEIAAAFCHCPTEHIKESLHRFYRDGRKIAHPYSLAAYSVPEEAVGDANDPVHWHAPKIFPPGVTGQTIVANHPEIGSVDGGVTHYVINQYLNTHTNQDFSAFVQYLQRYAPGNQDGNPTWYNKSWAMWSKDPSNHLDTEQVPCEVDTSLKYKDGSTVTDWPSPPGKSYPGIPVYNLSDEYDPPGGNNQHQSVIEAAGPTVKTTLLAIKNEDGLNGLLWNKQNGTVAKEQSNVDPTPGPVAEADVVADRGSAKGFTVKNQTSSYGLYLYADETNWDPEQKTLSFPVKNWPSRYLGAYVQFFKEDGEVIKRSQITAKDPQNPEKPFKWEDRVPLKQVVGFFAEPSDSKNYLTWLSSGNAVFGVPIPPLTQKTDLSFLWPDAASKADVLLGGLGCAAGFKDWDSDVDIVGLLGTGLVNYGVGTLTLAADVYIVNPFIAGLKGDGAVAFYAVCGVIGASALVVGVAERDNTYGKYILSKLAGIAASAIFGKVAERAIDAAARKLIITVFGEAVAETVAEMSAEEILEAVPVAGWALRVASVAADIADLAATTIESLASPATYKLEVLHTMDLTVTVKPDPRHGKKGFKPVWPLVSDHYVIQAKYPQAKNQEGGTTYTLAGPMPAQHDAAIEVTFKGIPAGGKIDVSADIYSDTNWLCGRWDSGWIDAIPDANDQLSAGGNITELLVPLTPQTTYSQKQVIAYSPTRKHYWQVTKFSIKAELVVDFDKGGKPDAAIVSAFSDNGNTLSSGSSITVKTPMKEWTLTDSASGVSYHVSSRQISIAKAFQLDLSKYKSELNAGGDTPSGVVNEFNTKVFKLPAGTQVTVVTKDEEWTIALAGQLPLYDLKADGGQINVNQTSYELEVQNTTNPGPPLPQTYPLSTSPSGHELGALQNIIHNNKEYELGYAYLASGQNLPLDNQSGKTNVPMYAMQSISTLGQPQDQIIQPARGFSLPTFLAYDQFGLTPLFWLDKSLESKLKDGPVPTDVADQFSAFGYKLPAGAQVTVVTAGKDWTIGVTGKDPIYQLRGATIEKTGKQVQVLGVYSWPIPKLDNYYLDPREYSASNPCYYLRGVPLDTPPGEYTFDYSTSTTWGIIQADSALQELAVHPHGYVIGLDNKNAKMYALKLPAEATPPQKAPLAMPLSGMGGRQGLLDSPQAMTINPDGRILILETGTKYIKKQRIQAFDPKGNPVPTFSVNQPHFNVPSTFSSDLDNRVVSLALLEEFQKNIHPALAPKASLSKSLSSVKADLDDKKVDNTLIAALTKYGLATEKTSSSDFSVTVTTPGKLWFVTNTKSKAVYDVRIEPDKYSIDHLYVYTAFALSITLRSAGADWKIEDTANAMTFEITKPATGQTLKVQQLISWMPLRQQNTPGLSYLDIATETKGFIYVLSVIDNNYNSTHNPDDLTFQLDIYNPDGSPLLDEPQTGVNAGKLSVDQWRSLFTLNFTPIIGPDNRTEPAVSEWEPSTPTPASKK